MKAAIDFFEKHAKLWTFITMPRCAYIPVTDEAREGVVMSGIKTHTKCSDRTLDATRKTLEYRAAGHGVAVGNFVKSGSG
ncbi:MAG: hypothetical protein M0Q23_07740 [Syntrophales bacterium]|jgi:hypothetical protein|nr:hypothetical protein [Syntrophales bacterium]MCK9528516.1 hypothetical protein [Syntrophales bacterium]MDX9922858.1 hypothetical protein [Syntrophales bacterium]